MGEDTPQGPVAGPILRDFPDLEHFMLGRGLHSTHERFVGAIEHIKIGAILRQTIEVTMTATKTGIILLVEDTAAERERAKQAIMGRGYKAAVATNLQDAHRIMDQLQGKIVGIVTDLHFPERADRPDATKPCGLAVVAEATRRNIPVAVCSDIDHHHADYAKVVVETLAMCHPAKFIPFVMDSKDWDRALGPLCDNL
jgi:CheY-like chemotaxis protein